MSADGELVETIVKRICDHGDKCDILGKGQRGLCKRKWHFTNLWEFSEGVSKHIVKDSTDNIPKLP